MSIYCIYLTVYQGNLLPPFYIGFSTVEKIAHGYHGSVSSQRYKAIWKAELKEKPHLFRTQIIRTYSSRKEACEAELRLQHKLNVILNPLYCNLGAWPYMDRTRIKHSEATRMKMREKALGRRHTEETKKKISENHSRWNRGKKGHLSFETRKKMSLASKRRIVKPETKEKLRLAALKQWQTNPPH